MTNMPRRGTHPRKDPEEFKNIVIGRGGFGNFKFHVAMCCPIGKVFQGDVVDFDIEFRVELREHPIVVVGTTVILMKDPRPGVISRRDIDINTWLKDPAGNTIGQVVDLKHGVNLDDRRKYEIFTRDGHKVAKMDYDEALLVVLVHTASSSVPLDRTRKMQIAQEHGSMNFKVWPKDWFETYIPDGPNISRFDEGPDQDGEIA